MKPLFTREGQLVFSDGSVFLPVVSSVGIESWAPEKDLLATKEWSNFVEKLEHKCMSGKCQHAMKPRCKVLSTQSCGCGGVGHMKARKNNGYRSMEEFFSSSPSHIVGAA